MDKFWIGLGLIVLGVCLGFYVGLWLLFIGGILQIAANIQPLETMEIAWGVIKILCSGFVGTIIGLVFIAPGIALCQD